MRKSPICYLSRKPSWLLLMKMDGPVYTWQCIMVRDKDIYLACVFAQKLIPFDRFDKWVSIIHLNRLRTGHENITNRLLRSNPSLVNFVSNRHATNRMERQTALELAINNGMGIRLLHVPLINTYANFLLLTGIFRKSRCRWVTS